MAKKKTVAKKPASRKTKVVKGKGGVKESRFFKPKVILAIVAVVAVVGGYFTYQSFAATTYPAAVDSRGSQYGNVKVTMCKWTDMEGQPTLMAYVTRPPQAPFGVQAVRTNITYSSSKTSSYVNSRWVNNHQGYGVGFYGMSTSATGIGVNIRFSNGELKSFKYFYSYGSYRLISYKSLPRC